MTNRQVYLQDSLAHSIVNAAQRIYWLQKKADRITQADYLHQLDELKMLNRAMAVRIDELRRESM